MCQFKSALAFRDGSVFWSHFTDRHEDLLLLRGLKDDKDPLLQHWVRIEYVPDEKWEKFTLNLDESSAPGWWDEDMRCAIAAKMQALIEAMTITDQIRKLIIARANTRELGKVAISQGMRTLRMVGLDRSREGVSTLEQVLLITSAH